MSEGNHRAVFLSYASQDAEAARRICEALRAAGVEVWFDQSELRGGDAWDAKIRKQIKECALFVPIISANTQARAEGYFRLEWKLAADRSHLIARDHPFLVPVVIDDTAAPSARVPEEFHAVQWTRLQRGDAAGDFAARVRSLLEVGAPTSSSASSLSVGATPAPPAKRPARKRVAIAMLAAVVTLVTVLGGGWWWKTRRVADAAAPSDNSIAVLAFANLSADKANEYFSDGISEEICKRLGTIPGLRVPATTSSFQFKTKQVAPADIARQLNVAYLLDGSVQKDGERVRIRARLINPRDGLPLWTSENFDRDIRDVFRLQDEIAALIARQLRISMRYVAGVNIAQVRPEAFQLYLQGRQAWSARGPGVEKAAQLFAAAIELDPKFGRAYAGLVDARLVNGSTRHASRMDDVRLEIARLAETAISLEPTSAEAHASRGHAHKTQWQFAAAEQSYQTALRLNPSYAHAHYLLASVAVCQGRMDEALASIARATDLDPLSSRMQDYYSNILLLAGRPAAALVHAELGIALDSTNGQAHGEKIDALLALGRTTEAVTTARELMRRRESAGDMHSIRSDSVMRALLTVGEQAPRVGAGRASS